MYLRHENYFDVMQVCLNGHQITDNYHSYPQHRKDYCPTCGERTIHTCPNCGKEIKGDYHVAGVVDFSKTPVPLICEYCGKDFPWREKQKKVKAAIQNKEIDSVFLVQQICDRFHLVIKQLRQRYDSRIPSK